MLIRKGCVEFRSNQNSTPLSGSVRNKKILVILPTCIYRTIVGS